MAGVDFPFRFESKNVLRYFLPGILAFCFFLPYIRDMLPFWKSITEIGQIGFGLFYSLAVGLIIEIIIDSYARWIFIRLIRLRLFTDTFRLENVELFLTPHVSEPVAISVLPPELQLDISMPNREVVWHTTAVAHMLVGCAIVFLAYSFVSFVDPLIYPFQINPIQILFAVFSLFMAYTCLRGGMKQAILRQQYIIALKAKSVKKKEIV